MINEKQNQHKIIIIHIINEVLASDLIPWPMEPGGSMPHSQGLSNNSYPEPN